MVYFGAGCFLNMDFNKKIALLLIKHVILALALGIVSLGYGCVFYNVFGVVCPGCGVTRAWLSLLSFDLIGALRFHALFLLIPPYLWFLIHGGCSFLSQARSHVRVFVIFFTVVLIAYNIFRIVGTACIDELNIFPKGYIYN